MWRLFAFTWWQQHWKHVHHNNRVKDDNDENELQQLVHQSSNRARGIALCRSCLTSSTYLHQSIIHAACSGCWMVILRCYLLYTDGCLFCWRAAYKWTQAGKDNRIGLSEVQPTLSRQWTKGDEQKDGREPGGEVWLFALYWYLGLCALYVLVCLCRCVQRHGEDREGIVRKRKQMMRGELIKVCVCVCVPWCLCVINLWPVASGSVSHWASHLHHTHTYKHTHTHLSSKSSA